MTTDTVHKKRGGSWGMRGSKFSPKSIPPGTCQFCRGRQIFKDGRPVNEDGTPHKCLSRRKW